MIKMPLHRFVIHLVVGDGGLKMRVPVDQALAADDEAVFEKFEKRVADGAGADATWCLLLCDLVAEA